MRDLNFAAVLSGSTSDVQKIGLGLIFHFSSVKLLKICTVLNKKLIWPHVSIPRTPMELGTVFVQFVCRMLNKIIPVQGPHKLLQ